MNTKESDGITLFGRIDDIDSELVLDLRSKHDILDEINESVRCDLERRREEVINDWQTILKDSKDKFDSFEASLEEWADQFRLASSVDSPQIRVMEDYVSRIRNYRSGEDIVILRQQEDRRNWLEEFLKFANDKSVSDSYVNDRTSFSDLFAHLDREG